MLSSMIGLCLIYISCLVEFRAFAIGIARPLSQSRLKSSCPEIPERLLFNYKINLVNASRSKPLGYQEQCLADNVAKSISMFSDMQDLQFGDDNECIAMIREAHSQQLANFFTKESDGRYKSDLCRLAQLYLHGGYYFDNDLEPISDFRLEIPRCTGLVSVASSTSGIFQAFLGASSRHPAIELAMNLTLEHYLHKLQEVPQGPLGTSIMELALREFTGRKHMYAGPSPNNVLLLKETPATRGRFKEEHMDQYDACNYGVWYGRKQLFYSRAIGRWTGRKCKRTERWTYVLPRFFYQLGHVLDFVSDRL